MVVTSIWGNMDIKKLIVIMKGHRVGLERENHEDHYKFYFWTFDVLENSPRIEEQGGRNKSQNVWSAPPPPTSSLGNIFHGDNLSDLFD
jgi:hypothetical protein